MEEIPYPEGGEAPALLPRAVCAPCLEVLHDTMGSLSWGGRLCDAGGFGTKAKPLHSFPAPFVVFGLHTAHKHNSQH